MKRLVILIVGLLIVQALAGTLVASAGAPPMPCPGSNCGGMGGPMGYTPVGYTGYFPYQGMSNGFSSPPLYFRYTYCTQSEYQPYVPAFYWWEFPYYPGCGTCWDQWHR